MNRLLAPSTNPNSAAGRCDRAVPDIPGRRPPRAGFRVGASSICGDARSKPALGETCSIFIGSPHARFPRRCPRIAL